MSTKITLSSDRDHHLYEESFDKDYVNLTLKRGNGLPRVSIDGVHAEVSLSIDVTLWRKIVNAWNASYWGLHPEWDHQEESED